MTSTGLFTAGQLAGTFMVVANCACGRADTATVQVAAPAAPPPVLTALSLTPATVTLAPGGTQQFAVSGTWSNGASTVPSVTYTATGGSVTSGGLYTAPGTAGTYRVIAAHTGGTLRDTSLVTVTAPPPVLTALSLTPATVTLAPGGTQQFAVSGSWSNGASTTPSVTYTATGGTVTSGGLYTAPGTAGTYRVIAAQSGGTLRDTSVVTVTAPAPPPGGGLANECASPGAGWIFCDDFDQNRLSSYFEVDNAGGRFVRESGSGNGGSFAMRGRYATSAQTSSGSLKLAFGRTPDSYMRPVDAGTANYREIYWRVYVRNQAGWVGGGGDKLTRAMSLVSGNWAQSMIANVWSGYGASINEFLYIDPASGTDATGTLRTTGYNDFANLRWLGAASGPLRLFSSANVGQWHCVEVRVRLNGAGQANGVFELWVNGQSQARQTTLNWVGSYSAYGINAIFLENFWNDGSPVAQDRFFDNFVVSTQRIGC